MRQSPLILSIREKKLVVSKKEGKNSELIEIIGIAMEYIASSERHSDDVINWEKTLKHLYDQFGSKISFLFLLGSEQVQAHTLERPPGVMKSEYPVFVPALISQWFDLPSDEISFDYRLDAKSFTVVAAPKHLVLTWQNRFRDHNINLIAIGAISDPIWKSNGSPNKMLNLLPWREKRAFLLFRYHLICMIVSVILITAFVFYSSRATVQKVATLRHKTMLLHSQYQRQKKLVTQKEALQEKLKKHDLELTRLQKQSIQNQRVQTIFKALGEQETFSVILDQFTYDRTSITIRGLADRYDAIQRRIARLGKLPFISEAKLAQLTQTQTHCTFEAYLNFIQE